MELQNLGHIDEDYALENHVIGENRAADGSRSTMLTITSFEELERQRRDPNYILRQSVVYNPDWEKPIPGPKEESDLEEDQRSDSTPASNKASSSTNQQHWLAQDEPRLLDTALDAIHGCTVYDNEDHPITGPAHHGSALSDPVDTTECIEMALSNREYPPNHQTEETWEQIYGKGSSVGVEIPPEIQEIANWLSPRRGLDQSGPQRGDLIRSKYQGVYFSAQGGLLQESTLWPWRGDLRLLDEEVWAWLFVPNLHARRKKEKIKVIRKSA